MEISYLRDRFTTGEDLVIVYLYQSLFSEIYENDDSFIYSTKKLLELNSIAFTN